MSATAESAEHRHLKLLALRWAQANGYPICAAEVSLPTFRFRLDAAAYRPGRAQELRHEAKSGRPRRVSVAALGLTAIFECKASRPDYLRDSRSISALTKRLAALGARKLQHEETLKLHYPSIRNGDSLFAEFETLNFERPGYEVYQHVLDEMRQLGARLHANTKFDKLTTWRAANVRYVVAEPGLFADHELPSDWGLLVRDGDELKLTRLPVFHEVEAAQRLALLHRIALTATRAANRAAESTVRTM